MDVTLDPFLSFEGKKKPGKRRTEHTEREHVLREYGQNKVVAIPPHIIERLGLVPGLDVAKAELDGSKVVLTFRRRGGFET